MPLTRWCWSCWAENPYEAEVCRACGADLHRETGDRIDRLIRSLAHPLPETRRLVAVLLGRSSDPRGVAALNQAARDAIAQHDWELLDGVLEGLTVGGRPEARTGLAYIAEHGPAGARRAAAVALRGLPSADAAQEESLPVDG